jgi:hypothetical protein
MLVFSFQITGLETIVQNRLPDPKNDAAKICKPLADLVEFLRLVKENKPKELKELLDKTLCDTKVQWREAIKWRDVSYVRSVMFIYLYFCRLNITMSAAFMRISDISCEAFQRYFLNHSQHDQLFSLANTRDAYDILLRSFSNKTC